jgi:crotonobetaine/carnitine-CoA ligase
MSLRGPAWERVPPPLRGLAPDALTLAGLLRRQADAHGERTLVRAGGEDRSYAATVEAVARWGGCLVEGGIAPGDRVAIMSPNRLEVLDLVLACSWVGAVPVMVNVALRGVQLRHILANSGARLLVADAELVEHVAGIEEPPGELEQVWTLGEPVDAAPAGLRAALAPIPGPGEPVAAREAKPWDPAVIIYTSGTTGLPKGVVCPQAQFFWWGVNTGWNLELGPDDVVSTCLPLFHTNALSAFVQALVFGATCSLNPRFSASRFWQRACDDGATVTFLLGAMVRILLEQPEREQDRAHRVRVALSPASPADTLAAFRERFGVALIEAYGSSETNHVMGALPGDQRPGTMGRILPGFAARVVGDGDVEVLDGEAGELLLRHDEPHSFALGYHAMPEQTVKAWRNLWFHTGDRVVREEDGRFRFLDRLTDSIRRRGENISSYEVEAAIAAYGDVEAAAVFPVPSELGEDEVMVAVVPRDPASFTPEGLVRALESRLAYFAIPRFVDVVDALPLTENGKVRKALLRERGVTATTWDAVAAGVAAAGRPAR